MSEEVSEKQCPKCGAKNAVAELSQRDYKCGDCGLELAHLDTNVQGAIRGVLGWLLDVGAEVGGRYRVTAVLGKGGFGVTYLVDDLRLHGKHRAMKEIPESSFDEHETRLLGRLSHPSVPDITDRFTVSGMVYLVLEFGGNRTLRIEQERRGGRIPVFVLLPWIRQLCDALQYLHEQDPPIVHRDLKPDNILLDDNDRIMLIDFGIAKEAVQDTVTRTLGRAVSQGFSPPEQVLGTGTDARSDVYALGAIIYNLLTGRMPAAAHERITGTEVEPLSRFLPEIPPLIEAAVIKALELNINLRQQSIAELTQVLDLVQSGTGSEATISVAGIGATSGQTTGAQVVLPSVQLHSEASSSRSGTNPSIRIQQPAAVPPAAPARAPRGSRSATLVLVGASVAAAGAVYWYLDTNGYIAEITGRGETNSQARKGGDKPPPAQAVVSDDNRATIASGASEQGGSERVGGKDLTQAEPAHPPVSVPAPNDIATPSLQEAPGGVSDGKSSTPGVAAPAAVVTNPPLDARGSTGASGVTTIPGTAAGKRTYSPSELPSIFSNEQNIANAPAKQTDSSASLMDVFEKHRSEVQAAEPPVAPVAPVAPTAPELASKPSTKPGAKKTATKRTKKTSRKRSSSKRAPSSVSAWGFKYKGAEKQ